MQENIESRIFTATIERRQDGEQPHIRGYAAKFGTWSELLGSFREKVEPGAFLKSLRDDVRALFNHSMNHVLGRVKSGTLSLFEDKTGLAVDITPPDTQWARDLMVSMKRGDLNQMSFAFKTLKDRWNHNVSPPERTLLEVQLIDVSVVTMPAYLHTEATVSERALREAQKTKRPLISPGLRDKKLKVLELEVSLDPHGRNGMLDAEISRLRRKHPRNFKHSTRK